MLLLVLLAVSSIRALQTGPLDVTLRNLPNSDQLPTQELLCIFQDSEGYMWYGTEGAGLCRDDGYKVDIFRSDFKNPGLLESNSVTSIIEDIEGKIWFSTKRGVYILSKKDYRITPFSDLEIKGWNIKTMKATSDGTIWISAGGQLLRYDASGKRVGKYVIQWKDESHTINSIYEDSKKTIWVTQHQGGLSRYNSETDQFVPYPWPYEEYPMSIVEDTLRACYWVGTWGRGIVRFDPGQRQPEQMFHSPNVEEGKPGAEKKKIHSIVQDAVKGYLWVTTTDNLYAYKVTGDGNLNQVNTTGFLSGDKKILSDIIADRSGNLWVTGYYPSSFIVSFLANEFVFQPMETVKEQLGVSASPMQLSREKDFYWIRQKKLGLYAYHPLDGNVSVLGNTLELSFFFEKPADGVGVYMVRNDSVLLFRDDRKQLVESVVCKVPVRKGERIRALHDDRQGNLWIGTTYNVFKYDLRQQNIQLICKEVGFVNDITSSEQGDVYFATEAKGLWKISGNEGRRIYDAQENYQKLSVAADQSLWIGTQQGNVYCYTPKDTSLVSKTKDCGLTGDIVLDIKPDSHGNIWILTAQRITIYNPHTQTADLICCSDSWIKLEDFQSLYRGGHGEMSIGGRGGIITFPDFNRTKEKIDEVPISLTSIKVNDGQRIMGSGDAKIILSPDEHNVELFLSTFNPLDINKIRYAFRDKRQGDSWNYLPVGKNSITMTGLSKGDYEIEVCATDESGLWSKNTMTVSIECLPAWYETWWVYMLYVFVALVVCGGLVRKYFKTGEVSRESVAQQKVETETVSISSSDEQLLKKVQEIIEQHISNSEYSVEDLSKDMCMSRATLYRKINSIAGVSPSDFMKNVRLQRAAELLKAGGLTIVEVADKVGFNTPSYFSKSFKKMFGVLPTQYK